METNREIKKGFMNGVRDYQGKVVDALQDVADYSMGEIYNSKVDYCDGLFSRGFMNAIEEGKTPVIGSEIKAAGWDYKHGGKEYHHMISNNDCYVVFFQEN